MLLSVCVNSSASLFTADVSLAYFAFLRVGEFAVANGKPAHKVICRDEVYLDTKSEK